MRGLKFSRSNLFSNLFAFWNDLFCFRQPLNYSLHARSSNVTWTKYTAAHMKWPCHGIPPNSNSFTVKELVFPVNCNAVCNCSTISTCTIPNIKLFKTKQPAGKKLFIKTRCQMTTKGTWDFGQSPSLTFSKLLSPQNNPNNYLLVKVVANTHVQPLNRF